jgi:biotin transporter BioY
MFIETNLTNTVLGVLFIIGAILVSFSKEKNEDEFIAIIRLKSLLWAVLVNYMLLIIAFLLVYELPFFTVMTFNMFTVLLLFIFRFHFLLYRSKSAMANEK